MPITLQREPLAIHGGKPAVTQPLPPSLQGVLDIGQEEIDAVTAVLHRKTIWRFLNSPDVSESAKLEVAYKQFLGVEHTLALGGGGTGALICALVGLGIGSGDEVIIPGYTYIATAAACLSVGAIPILAEVNESLTLDPADVQRKITPYTRAILPVHMRGTPADMHALMAIAAKHNLKVLEDCAQSNGGSYKGKMLGSIGHAGAFSLQHFKIITAGEGGIVSTNDATVFRRAAMKHDSALQFWRPNEPWETFAGENYRMCEMRAAVGLVQFGRMPAILDKCRATKRALRHQTRSLSKLRQQPLPCEAGDCGVAFNVFLADGVSAKRFSEALAAEGVKNATIYNKAIPDRHIYAAWDYVLEKRTSDHTGWPWTAAHRPIHYSPDMLPQTLDVLGRCISIGLNHQWTDLQITQVAAAFQKVHDALADRGEI